MLTLLKLTAAAVIAAGILGPVGGPSADTCECKAKAAAVTKVVPHADYCECKAKSTP